MNREDEIRKEIWKLKDMYDKKKWNLVLKTWAVLSVVLYVSAFASKNMHEPIDYLTGIVIYAAVAGLIFFASIIVTLPFDILREKEIETLTRLRIELAMIEKGLLQNNDVEQ